MADSGRIPPPFYYGIPGERHLICAILLLINIQISEILRTGELNQKPMFTPERTPSPVRDFSLYYMVLDIYLGYQFTGHKASHPSQSCLTRCRMIIRLGPPFGAIIHQVQLVCLLK